MIEDREGKGVEALAEVVDRFLRRRPASGPSWPASSPRFSARVPQLQFDLDRTKARRLDVAGLRRLRRPPDQPRRLLCQRLQPLRQGLEGDGPGRGRRPHASPRTSPSLYVLNRKGKKVPARLARRGQLRRSGRSTCRTTTCTPPPRSTAGPRPGYSSGQAIAAMEERRRGGPARGVRLRVDRDDLPGAEDRQPGDVHLRPVDRLRLPVHGGPVRELGPAAGDHLDRPAGDVRRGRRALALRHAARRLRPDRPGHADRPGDEERHPDRRVRRRAAGRSTG